MAAENDFYQSEVCSFNEHSARLFRLIYQDNEEFKIELNHTLDSLNTLEYSLKFVPEETAGRVLAHCCTLIPYHLEHSIVKVALLVSNLVNKQQIVLKNNLDVVSEYFIAALRQSKTWLYADILRALSVIFYENVGSLTKYEAELVGRGGRLFTLCSSPDEDVCRAAVQCIENLTIRGPSGASYLDPESQTASFSCLLSIIHRPKPPNMDLPIYLKMVCSGFRGIQNILLAVKSLPVPDSLGSLLAAVKVHMFSGLPGIAAVHADTLDPAPMNHFQKVAPVTNRTTANKKLKKRKGKDKKQDKEAAEEEELSHEMEQLNVSHDPMGSSTQGTPSFLLKSLSTMSSSESEFSDTEGAQVGRLRSVHSRLRHASLLTFLALVKAVERRVMFGYWNSFLPDVPGFGGPPTSLTLFTVIMKDSSPKVRTAALAVLSALLEGSKQFLQAAEESDQYRNAPFTPFSVTQGYMLKEIHRCLLLSLVSETSPLTSLQIIKCLAVLITNVPYRRLKPGLMSRVVKQIKPYISHRDSNIRVACLTCLGSIAVAQAPDLEVSHILHGSRLNTRPCDNTTDLSTDKESGYQTSSGTTTMSQSPGMATPPISVATPTSGLLTPPTPVATPTSGLVTPPTSNTMAEGELSWVVKLALKNIAPHLLDETAIRGSEPPQPLPIRLESLQLLCRLTKGHFSILRPSFPVMKDLILLCLQDTEPAVQLHGVKLLGDISAAFIFPKQPAETTEATQTGIMTAQPPDDAIAEQMLNMWLPLLNEAVPMVIQTTNYATIKYTMCDCLSSMGPHVFSKLPTDKHILCITLLLGLTSDTDHHTRAAAVRALGVYVLYPCLREDVGFVADTANVIINTLQEQNVLVKVKAAWSLGNLTDAIVQNRLENDVAFMEDFADMLLLKLFEVAVRASEDSDKVRCNAVRALGSLLLYLPPDHRNIRFQHAVENAIEALVKNVTSGSVKLRWNACYAVGKMFRNEALSLTSKSWLIKVHLALVTSIKDCKNFKVRINAAMALAVPAVRGYYGDGKLMASIWECLMMTMEESDAVPDVTELKYRDNLTEQVCSTLVHLSSLLESGDLVHLRPVLPKQDHVQHHINKYMLLCDTAQDSSKGEKLVSAQTHLADLSSQNLSEEEKGVIHSLIQLFTPRPTDALSHVDTTPPKTAFKQTYD